MEAPQSVANLLSEGETPHHDVVSACVAEPPGVYGRGHLVGVDVVGWLCIYVGLPLLGNL